MASPLGRWVPHPKRRERGYRAGDPGGSTFARTSPPRLPHPGFPPHAPGGELGHPEQRHVHQVV